MSTPSKTPAADTGSLPNVVVLLGPTAVGKTQVAIELAKRFDGEIVSVDSRLLYRGMDIGTAKPSAAQRSRVPHHLIDVAEPDESWSMARYLRRAKDVIRDLDHKGRLSFLVGGTGQYLTALLEGWSPPLESEDPQLRDSLSNFAATHGSEALHRRLMEVDPELAQRMDHRNVRRVVRALELYELTGRRPSELRRKRPSELDSLQIGLELPRPELYARIDERIDRMLASGWLQEVANLRARGITPDQPALSAIGYRQLWEHLAGQCSLEDAIQATRRLTRQLVRRQMTWFRRPSYHIQWFEARPGVEDRIEEVIRAWLKGGGPTRAPVG